MITPRPGIVACVLAIAWLAGAGAPPARGAAPDSAAVESPRRPRPRATAPT